MSSPGLIEAEPSFRVVAVGASAGGIAAVSELLGHLGAEPGLAVVIIPHLDPSHESRLTEILSRKSALPVRVVNDGLVVAPNHAYVLPPNAGVLIHDGALRLTPRDETRPHLPIDQFFASLADDCGPRAVGVLLSGGGSDGAAGTRAIRNAGGVTFAHDASAEHRAMPEAAIETGCVDFVLGPKAIAHELLRIGARPVPTSHETDDEHDLQRVLRALTAASGIDFAMYKPDTMRRRIERRVLVRGLDRLRDYAEVVERSPDEATALSEDVLVHVTSFFRDPETFEALRRRVIPELLAARPRDATLRIWVPGCSTGEEVYSIAITFVEHLTDADRLDIPIKLFGTDVSLHVIDKARAAYYPTSIAHQASPERLRRFFTRSESGYQVRKDLRDLCVFARQDATRDPPLSGLDLISCRNLMIYLRPALQEHVLPMFHHALKEPGFLLLGTSESVRAFPGFATVDEKNKIFARVPVRPLPSEVGAERARQPARVEAKARTEIEPPGSHDVRREADRVVLAEFGPPGVVITDDLAIVQFRGRTGPFLEPSPGMASFDLLRMVRQELRVPLRQLIELARANTMVAHRNGVILGPGLVVDLEVIPFRVESSPLRHFVVLFNSSVSRDTRRRPGQRDRAPEPERAPAHGGAHLDARLPQGGHRAARGERRRARGQQGDPVAQRGAARLQRGATAGQGAAAGDQRGAAYRQRRDGRAQHRGHAP